MREPGREVSSTSDGRLATTTLLGGIPRARLLVMIPLAWNGFLATQKISSRICSSFTRTVCAGAGGGYATSRPANDPGTKGLGSRRAYLRNAGFRILGSFGFRKRDGAKLRHQR